MGGYLRLLDILKDPGHGEHARMVEWLQGHEKNYHPYDPDAFDSAQVHFDDPRQRWRAAFASPEI